MKYYIQTFGCQMNYSDSERVEGYMSALGFEKSKSLKDCDLVIYNTCSIKQKAEDKMFGELKKIIALKLKKPDLMVMITGCMIRLSSSRYSVKRDKLFNRARELDIALRISELPKLAGLIREINPDLNIQEIEEENLEDYLKIEASHNSHKSNAQAFIAISNGCDKFCTYCIVPYSRGREKSRKMQDIIDESTALVEKGCKEITLIGQTVNSYGLSDYDMEENRFDSDEPFVQLLIELDKLKEKGLKRLRFTSPHPKDMSDKLIDTMGDLDTLMPYLHLPVQAGDDNTLKRMNRAYNVEKYLDIIKKLREKIPDISITTDIIVGFCGETDEEFKNTYNFFKDIAFEHAYISQYSERVGTTASKFIKDDIPSKTKKERWHTINNLLKETSDKAFLRFIGRTVEVLVETQNKGICLGRDPNFKTVQFKSDKDIIGEIVQVKITGHLPWILEGDLVDSSLV